MEIIKKQTGEKVILALSGKLDSSTAVVLDDEINKILLTRKISDLEIDMENLSYLSSAGLRVLLAVQKEMNSLEGNLVITHVNETIHSVFEITGFLGILKIV